MLMYFILSVYILIMRIFEAKEHCMFGLSSKLAHMHSSVNHKLVHLSRLNTVGLHVTNTRQVLSLLRICWYYSISR